MVSITSPKWNVHLIQIGPDLLLFCQSSSRSQPYYICPSLEKACHLLTVNSKTPQLSISIDHSIPFYLHRDSLFLLLSLHREQILGVPLHPTPDFSAVDYFSVSLYILSNKIMCLHPCTWQNSQARLHFYLSIHSVIKNLHHMWQNQFYMSLLLWIN